MIPYIYLIVFVGFALIALAFNLKEYAIGAFGSMLLMAIGVYIIGYGLTSVTNFITQTFAIILIGVGAYVLIRGAFETF